MAMQHDDIPVTAKDPRGPAWALQRRMNTILSDELAIRADVKRLLKTATAEAKPRLGAIFARAAAIDRQVRELRAALPAALRAVGEEPAHHPRLPNRTGLGTQGTPDPPGGKLPRRVRYPALTVDEILGLAQLHYARTGRWPTGADGRVAEDRQDTWCGIELALRHGNRDLPGGMSLAALLRERLGARKPRYEMRLTEETILAWADEHKARTGEWPNCNSGKIAVAPGETWRVADGALRKTLRGIIVKSSLALLLEQRRGVPQRHEELWLWLPRSPPERQSRRSKPDGLHPHVHGALAGPAQLRQTEVRSARSERPDTRRRRALSM